ncbi:hypothetical protein Plhal304r1_c008g0030691 [Plasmopara halstedii]
MTYDCITGLTSTITRWPVSNLDWRIMFLNNIKTNVEYNDRSLRSKQALVSSGTRNPVSSTSPHVRRIGDNDFEVSAHQHTKPSSSDPSKLPPQH